MHKRNNLKRFFCGLLSVIMLIGMMPLSTFADNTGPTLRDIHGSSISNNTNGTAFSPKGWTWSGRNDFSRISLVKFPNESNNPENYQVLGVVDIVADSQWTHATSSMWIGATFDNSFAANNGLYLRGSTGDFGRPYCAVDYLNMDAKTLAGGSIYYAGEYQVSQSSFQAIAAKYLSAYKTAFPDRITSENSYLFDSSKVDGKKITVDYKSLPNGTKDAHISQFGTKQIGTATNTNRSIYEENTNWNALLLMLSAGCPPQWFAEQSQDVQLKAIKNCIDYQAFTEENGCNYRVIVETGAYAQGIYDSDLKRKNSDLLVTLRDACLMDVLTTSRPMAVSLAGVWDDFLGNPLRSRNNEFEVYDRGEFGTVYKATNDPGKALDAAIAKRQSEQKYSFLPLPNVAPSSATSLSSVGQAMLKNYPHGTLSGLTKNGSYGMAVISPYMFASNTIPADLIIKKTVLGVDDGRDWEFEIAFDCSMEQLKTATYTISSGQSVKLSSNPFQFTLKNGDQIKFNEIPDGTSYTVRELNANADGYVTSINGTVSATGEFKGNTAQVIHYENAKEQEGLTVKKIVTGNGDKSLNFDFSVTLDFSGVEAPSEVTYTKNGSSSQKLPVSGTSLTHSFSLKDGESANFDNLPKGTKWDVKETPAAEYKASYSPGQSGTLNGPTVVTVTNTLPKDPDPTPTEDKIRKVDAATGQGVGPATFRIYGQADGMFDREAHLVDEFVTTDANGVYQFQWTEPDGENYIPPGQYTITEVIPPPGYALTTEAHHLVLFYDPGSEGEEGGGETKAATGKEDKEEKREPQAYSSGDLVFKNPKKLIIKLLKQDANTGDPLPGAVFDVYKDEQKIGSVGPTGADGTVIYDGRDGMGLEEGTYKFVEVQAPPGYFLPARYNT